MAVKGHDGGLGRDLTREAGPWQMLTQVLEVVAPSWTGADRWGPV
jgi:hypothetical protein